MRVEFEKVVKVLVIKHHGNIRYYSAGCVIELTNDMDVKFD